MRPLIALATTLLGACASTAAPRPDAATERLECEAPLRAPLTPSVRPPNTGVPVAGFAWIDGRCAIELDETHPDQVLVIADFAGTIFRYLSANAANGWLIAETSHGSAPTTYIVEFGRDTDVTVVMERQERDGVRVEIVFRVESDGTVVLLSMRLV